MERAVAGYFGCNPERRWARLPPAPSGPVSAGCSEDENDSSQLAQKIYACDASVPYRKWGEFFDFLAEWKPPRDLTAVPNPHAARGAEVRVIGLARDLTTDTTCATRVEIVPYPTVRAGTRCGVCARASRARSLPISDGAGLRAACASYFFFPRRCRCVVLHCYFWQDTERVGSLEARHNRSDLDLLRTCASSR